MTSNMDHIGTRKRGRAHSADPTLVRIVAVSRLSHRCDPPLGQRF